MSFFLMTSILVIVLPCYLPVCFLLIQAEELQPGYSVSNYMFVAKVRKRTVKDHFECFTVNIGYL